MRQVIYPSTSGPVAPVPPNKLPPPYIEPPVITRKAQIASVIAVVAYTSFAPAPLNLPPNAPVGGFQDFPEIVQTPIRPPQFSDLPIQAVAQTTAQPFVQDYQFGIAFTKPFPITEQQYNTLALPFTAAFTAIVGANLAEFPAGVKTPDTQPTFASFQPIPIATVATTAFGYQSWEVKFAKPLPPALQQFNSRVEFTTVTIADGWRNYQLDYAFVKPLPAARQQFTVSQSPSLVIYPEGWRNYQLEYAFAKPVKAAVQQYVTFHFAAQAATTFNDGWRNYQLEYQFAKPVKSALQQFASFQAQGTITNVAAVEGWRNYQLDYQFAKPLAAAEQRFSYLQASSPAATTQLVGGWADLPEVVQTPTLPQDFVYFQSFGTFTPTTATVVDGWQNSGFRLTIRLFRIAAQPDTMLGPSSVTFADGWRNYQLDYQFAKPVNPTVQQFASFQPRGTITNVPVSEGWRNHQWDYVFAKPVKPALNQLSAFQALGTITPLATVEGWRNYQLAYQFAQPVKSALQQFASFQALGTITARATVEGWRNYQLDYQFAKPLSASLQRLAYFQPSGSITNPTAVGGFQDFPEIAQTPVLPQQFTYFQPLGTITPAVVGGIFTDFPAIVSVTTPDLQPYSTTFFSFTSQFVASGYYSEEFGYRFAKPVKPALNQLSAFQPFGTFTPTAISFGWQNAGFRLSVLQYRIAAQPDTMIGPSGQTFPEGWRNYQLDYAFAKPLAPALQRFDYFQSPGTITNVAVVEGWRNYQLDYRFTAPYPVSLQQLAYFQPSGTLTNPTSKSGFQDFPEIVQTPVLPQQFTYFQPLGTVTATVFGGVFNDFPAIVYLTTPDLQPFSTTFLKFTSQFVASGYYSEQFGYRFAKRYPVNLQQYEPFSIAQTAQQVPLAFVQGSSWGISFTKPFPITEQQFGYFPASGTIINLDFHTRFYIANVGLLMGIR